MLLRLLRPLVDSPQHLALTADTYLETYLTGILKATGFSKTLLNKMVENEINDLAASVSNCGGLNN